MSILEEKKEVKKYNLELINKKLVLGTFGNASKRYNDCIIIKPSGVSLDEVSSDDMVQVNIDDRSYNSHYKPSSDTSTHIELYKEFKQIGAVVHSHSPYATAWAQANSSIPCYGTTHADYWRGPVPITRELTSNEIFGDYEGNTGKVIIERIRELKIDPLDCPGILIAHHGPFTWGKSLKDAVRYAELLEYISKIAWHTYCIDNKAKSAPSDLIDKHFSRKQGPAAYYGQDED